MPRKRDLSSLNANAPEFVPSTVQQIRQSQRYTAQRVNPGQVPQSPTGKGPHILAGVADSAHVIEPIDGPYGYVTGAIAAAKAPSHLASTQVQSAIPGIRDGLAGPMNAHPLGRENRLYNPYPIILPIDAHPGTSGFLTTGYSYHGNRFTASSNLGNFDAASARLLSIRYGFDPNDPAHGGPPLPTTGHGNSLLLHPFACANPYHSAGASKDIPFQNSNQYEAFDIMKATGPQKSAEATPTCTDSAQDSPDDEDDYEEGTDEEIWTETSCIGPKVPRKYKLDNEIKLDEKGYDIPWADKPLPPPFPYQKRILHPEPSIQGRIPLYGALSGMQYDHNTKLYHGDGPPRSTPFRPDGTGPCPSDQAHDIQVRTISVDTRKLPNDILHLQPMLEVRDNMLDFGANGIATMKFCCCINNWGLESAMVEHVCTEPALGSRARATPMRTKKARSADWFGLVSCHTEREVTQAEKSMRPPINVGIATGTGDSNKTWVEVRDLGNLRM